ncbi:glycosyltransferase family 4 protein [Hymenobacter swuensis]|nr:glycosyltransferase family 4 protein [Hymenobacter swuensis]
MARILCVLHEASRTGAPFTQLHLMRWLRQHSGHELMLVLLRGGALEPEFAQVSQVEVITPTYVPGRSLAARAFSRLGQVVASNEKRVLKAAQQFAPDVIYANTAVVVEFAAQLKRLLRVPLISNLHELETTFYYHSKAEFANSAAQVDAFVMGSEAVRQYYLQEFGVAPERAHRIYDFTGPVPTAAPVLRDIRAELGLAPGTRLVGGMASLGWRKGPDLFVDVARRIAAQTEDVHCLWVGGNTLSGTYQELRRDVRLLGLEHRVTLAGEQADIASYYAAFDVFLLTSREDPFPLVCLEAALSETPVLCFANSGGMPEFVRDDAGVVVPYLDTAAMAQQALNLLNDESRRRQLGYTAQQRVLSSHTIDAVGPAILQLIEATIATRPVGA